MNKTTTHHSSLKETSSSEKPNHAEDVLLINKIPIIPQLLDVICRSTGMGFAVIARVTEEKWTTCSTKDKISFGLKPGDELDIETTFCNTVRQSNSPIYIENVDEDPDFKDHSIPKMYGFKSYISVPIYRNDGSFFGTLCAIDPNASKVKTVEIEGMFSLFSELISFHLEAIDERKIAEEKLSEEKRIAELREQFIAILGHDLRNPIATTRMSADILLAISKEELVLKQAKMIRSTSLRMEVLINNMLDFAHGKLGEGIQLKKETDNEKLKKSLQQIINEIKLISPNREIETDFNLDDGIHCDTNRIGQLFSNLLSNANHHGDKDKPIKVSAINSDGLFRLSVKNEGDPIPKTSLEHLFKPFYKEDENSNKQGLGLGLFIASEIAKAHDGSIKVKSTEEETQFLFTMKC